MINFDLKDRVAIVTGGAQGFGLAITERFIASGASVVIWDIDEVAIKTETKKIKVPKNTESANCKSELIARTPKLTPKRIKQKNAQENTKSAHSTGEISSGCQIDTKNIERKQNRSREYNVGAQQS